MTDIKNQESIAARYDEFSGWGKSPDEANRERIKVTQSIVPAGVQSILDLGCGDGIVTNRFAEQGVDVVGCDFSRVALSFMKGKRIVSSVDNVPFPDHCFDLVVCAETLEHLPDDIFHKTLKEIERVAKSYIIISTPHNEYLPAARIRCEHCKKIFHRNLHVRSFDKDSHKSLFGRFVCKQTIGVRERREVPQVIDFQRNILGVYVSGKGISCPFCGKTIERKPGIWHRLVLELGRRISGVIPTAKSDRWVVSLYQRVDVG